MKLAQMILKAANFVVSFLVAAGLLTTGAYAAYALWDNNTVYAAAENVQAEMLRLKPVAPTEEVAETGASFKKLLAINPDVRAWVSLDNTRIDFPVLQGASNLSYINTDVYGNYALAGSIFLDSRSDGTFHDDYSLIYGHHVVDGKMFGDLTLYKDEKFFNANQTGQLILPDRSYRLIIYACLVIPASDDIFFDPDHQKDGLSDLLDYTEQHALYLRPEMTQSLRQGTANHKTQMLSLTTCSAEFTDARTIILAVMEPSMPKE